MKASPVPHDTQSAKQPNVVRQLDLSNRDRRSIMFGILTAMLLAALDQSIVTPAMPTIGGDLGDSHYLPWIVTAYLLTATAVAPLYGKFSDIHGRRRTLYVALGLFLLGSIVAAIASNMFILIGARAIQGLGGGGLFALTQIIIGDILPPRERGRYAAWISGMWAVAGIAGPLLGGTLAEYYWPLIFWINLPLGLVAMLIISEPLKKLVLPARSHRLDGLGAVLLVAATSALLLMLNWAGSSYAWTSPQILALAVASLALWVGFAVRILHASEPLVSLDVLSNRIVLTGCFALFLVSACNIGLAVYLPVYAQAYLDFSPADAGYALLGFLIGSVSGATLGGRLTLRIVHVKRISITGAIISALGFVAIGLLADQTSIIVLEILLITVGVGMGMTFPVTTVSVQNGVDPMHLGVATGMLTFLRSLGSALGVAALGAIALSYGIPLGAEGANGTVMHMTSASPFAVLYFTMAGMMITAAIIYVVMPHKALRGKPESTLVE
ncbi:MAG: MFS transporter [Rhizobiaceae bacterium]|nr:MFS transporter [Rhizobiaceae bacterium]